MKHFFRRFRQNRRARRILADLFADPARLEGSSLRPSHATRADLVSVEEVEGEIRAVLFTILRHPRPYAFSRQYHEVLELYRYDCVTGAITVEQSLNVTRHRGQDGAGRI